MTKYHWWPSLLNDKMCPFTKANVVLLPTLAFNKRTIVGTIDVLQTIAICLDLTDKMLNNKVVIMRDNLLIIRNA